MKTQASPFLTLTQAFESCSLKRHLHRKTSYTSFAQLTKYYSLEEFHCSVLQKAAICRLLASLVN
jgi:hypothetical protein